jgi:ornithine cyclodeaminase/alanine dehydrogenase-like protein (mu-crystallin family)
LTLILSNEEIGQLISMQDVIDRLDLTYQDLGNGLAQNRPRSDIYGPFQDNTRYVFKTMDGLVPRFEAAAIRLNSDNIRWNVTPAGIRKDKQPTGPGGKWIGLVLLFSTRTGEPLAIMPDGMMQSMRVAATNALGAKYMAPDRTPVYALIGAGQQAAAQARAMAKVRKFEEIRIYSPTRATREKLAGELAGELGITVRACDSAETAVRGADIVGMATNSITPVVEAAWLEPHAHVTCVKELELGAGILGRSALVAVHTRLDRPANYIVGQGENPIYDHDPAAGLPDEVAKTRTSRPANEVDLTKQIDLGELAAGRFQLPPAGSMTTFVNTVGMGLQFAAIASLVWEKAVAAGKGRDIPTDWFLEDMHP